MDPYKKPFKNWRKSDIIDACRDYGLSEEQLKLLDFFSADRLRAVVLKREQDPETKRVVYIPNPKEMERMKEPEYLEYLQPSFVLSIFKNGPAYCQYYERDENWKLTKKRLEVGIMKDGYFYPESGGETKASWKGFKLIEYLSDLPK